MTVFTDQVGNNTYRGSAVDYDQVDFDAHLSEYSIFTNANGSVTVSHPTLGTDTLFDIDGIWSIADSQWYSIADAIALTGDAPAPAPSPGPTSPDANDFVLDDFGVLRGTDANDLLLDTSEINSLYGGEGNDTLIGTAGEYSQAEYDGSASEFSFTQNNDGTLTVSHPVWGTDTLSNIDGFWFQDEQRWYSIDDVIALGNDNSADDNANDDNVSSDGEVINGTSDADVLAGGDGSDVINGGARGDTLFGGNGADTLNGENGFDSIDGGNGADVINGGNGNDFLLGGNGNDTFTFNSGDGHDLIADFNVNADSVDLSDLGLSFEELFITTNSDGHVAIFISENQSITFSNLSNPAELDASNFILDASEAPAPAPTPTPAPTPAPTPTPEPTPAPEPAPGPDTGTTIDGVITGSNDVNDFLNGTNGNDTFFAGRGTDVITGGAGNDTLNVDGDIIEWTFSANADGSVTMTHPTWGQNTLVGIENIFSQRGGESFTIDEAIALTDGLPRFRLDNDNVINGTNGNDTLQGGGDIQGFYGGTGNDVYFGSDDFDQVNYDGARSEYTITENNNGSITVDHPIWGTDTLNDIDGLVFTGVEPGVGGAQTAAFEFISTDDLFA